MSFKKVGGATAVAGGIGAGIGAYSNENARGEGALKGAAVAAGATAGVGLFYKGVNHYYDKIGYKQLSVDDISNQMDFFGKNLKSVYDAANSKEGLAFIEAGNKNYTKGISSNKFTEAMGYMPNRPKGSLADSVLESSMNGPMAGITENNQTVMDVHGSAKFFGAQALDMIKMGPDLIKDYTFKPGMDFVKNVGSGNFKDLSVNQGAGLAASLYTAYSAGAAVSDFSKGENADGMGHVNSAFLATGLQAKGGALYSGVKAYIKNDLSVKGIKNTLKFSKYSDSYLDDYAENRHIIGSR